MLEINKNNIKLTRGDSAVIDLVIYMPDGTIYELEEGDKVYFGVRLLPKKAPGEQMLLEKEFESNEIKIESGDTAFLKYGRYFYDCSLIFADGDINTICAGNFTITHEVN